MNEGKEYKASRLEGLERVRGGEKVIIRARERKEETRICSSRLSRSCLTLSGIYFMVESHKCTGNIHSV